MQYSRLTAHHHLREMVEGALLVLRQSRADMGPDVGTKDVLRVPKL